MQEIAAVLERNAEGVRYGTVGVEVHIHNGRVVKAVYRTAVTDVRRGGGPEKSGAEDDRRR